jgi:carboxyl-terminal processing protease
MIMKRRLTYGAVLVVLGINLALGARAYRSSAAGAEKDSAYSSMEMFGFVMEKVRKDFVDGEKLTYRELVNRALKGLVGTLDPHSEFMEPSDYKELQDDTQGTFGGLGIVVSVRDNALTVVAPMDDSPGFRAGIMTGDRILRIDNKSMEKVSLPDAVKSLRGEPGSEVTLTVLRPSTGATKEFQLKRAEIKVDMVKDINNKREFPLCENRIGYIRLVQFGEKTASELEEALRKLKAQGMQALVLDLRWNPGGLLDQAVDVCEKFLPRGKLVVSTEGRNKAQNSTRRATGRGDELVAKDGAPLPMVVLVNLGSASASEIVAGCLQDSKRAIVLGEQSFGKGSVQTIIPLSDGYALRLTTAKYYTPSHKVIHEKGITPDIPVAMSEEDERDILMQRVPGGVESLEPKDRERIKNVHDLQLERALDLLKGITLFTSREHVPAKPLKSPDKMAAR